MNTPKDENDVLAVATATGELLETQLAFLERVKINHPLHGLELTFFSPLQRAKHLAWRTQNEEGIRACRELIDELRAIVADHDSGRRDIDVHIERGELALSFTLSDENNARAKHKSEAWRARVVAYLAEVIEGFEALDRL